jgi:two-component system, response regulator PdtaR
MAFTVVVAEDDELIRLLTVEALTDAGFIVLEAEHAEDALKHLNGSASEIHLLFTDVNMPGDMDGLDLALHTNGHWPWIAVLIASGRPLPKTRDMLEGHRFLPKPYRPETIVTHARELVGAS